VVVPAAVPVVNVLPVDALVKPLELVEKVDAPDVPTIVDVAAVVPTIREKINITVKEIKIILTSSCFSTCFNV
jgi:hypothetical protein